MQPYTIAELEKVRVAGLQASPATFRVAWNHAGYVVEPEWYLPDTEAAKLLNCHRRDVRELVEKGMLKFIVTPDGKLKISKESVYRLLSLNS